MGNNFNLSSLIPEGLTFIDDGAGGDGTQYAVRLPAMFDSYEYAQMAKLQDELPGHLKKIASLGESGPEAAQAALVLDGVINDFMQLLIPDLPDERVKRIALGYKLEFIKWWKQQLPAQPKAADQAKAAQRLGEVRGRAKTARGKRSPDSSTSTA